MIRALLKEQFDLKQVEKDPTVRFIDKNVVDNIIYQVAHNIVPIEVYQHIDFDFSELHDKVRQQLHNFLKSKYFSNVKNKTFPELLKRKVSRHSKEVRISVENLDQSDLEQNKKLEVVIGDLGSLINSSKPTFLFGEIGSGKSTLLAHHFLTELINSAGPVIFIPSTFLKGKVPVELKVYKEIVNQFVNEELNLTNKIFDLDAILLAKNEVTLVIDGLDEFDKGEASRLLQHLLHLARNNNRLRIIASGRPVELKDLVNFNEWNCLTTRNLTEPEIKQLLKNEAIAAGIGKTDADSDAVKRLKILQEKPELLANATTPLIVCLIRDYLDEKLHSKTLGDILYDVVKRRLDWHKDDQKEDLKLFIDAFPLALQREGFIAAIAYKIYHSQDGKISEDILFQVVNSEELILKTLDNRNKVVSEAIKFFKTSFLQEIDGYYAFQSHQLHQVAVGLALYSQVCAGKEFSFKQDKLYEWREISYACAIARTKGESGQLKNFLAEFIDELLINDTNTSAVAVVLAEAQISAINKTFFKKVNTFGFRPLKFWGKSDSSVPHAYAYLLKDVGQPAFNWFFENYLDPKHPTHTGLDEVAEWVLRHYFVLNDYSPPKYVKSNLYSIIPFHLTVRTFTCNTLLPIFSLVVPEAFKVNERCRLLADVMNRNIVSGRAEDILRKEWVDGNEKEVLTGLEVVCGDTNSKNPNALKLWLQLSDGVLPKLILNNGIVSIAKGDEDIFPVLKQRIAEPNFIGYLKYCTLTKNDISDAAAIILYNFYGERDPILIGETILSKTSILDYKEAEREEILKTIFLSKKGVSEEFIVGNIPRSDGRLGIPETYLKYFLLTLASSKKLYVNELIWVITDMNKFSLSRYPEIRESFLEVLSIREYRKAVQNLLSHLDNSIRYNAAKVLLACFPESETSALEIVIRSSFKKLSDNAEWLRFCMKLNYSRIMLDHMHSLLDDVTEVSRIFILKLLYHNKQYKLNQKLKEELITGLLEKAHFLDWSGTFDHDGIESLLAKEEHFETIRKNLEADTYKLKQSAASSLIYHHQSQLTIKEKAKCWLLHTQYAESALVNFYDDHHDLLDNIEFTQELKKCGKKMQTELNNCEFLFLKYYEALKENGDWKDFFIALIHTRPHFDSHRIEHLYGLINHLGNNNKKVGEKIGVAAKELMAYPAFSQNREHNQLIPQLAVLANEFGSLDNKETEAIVLGYRIYQDEIACALLYRVGAIPDQYHPDRGNKDYIALFKKNNVVVFNKVDKKELDKILTDWEDIPKDLDTVIESTLLYESLTKGDLVSLSNKGNLSTYFAIIIGFCTSATLILDDFVRAEEIGGYNYLAIGRTKYHKAILQRLKNVVLSEPQSKDNYVQVLIESIGNDTPEHDVDTFSELFQLKVKFAPDLLTHLFDAFIEIPFKLNLRLVYQINEFIVEKTSIKERKVLVAPLKKQLLAVTNSGNERHEKELELIAWTISLILLYIEGKSEKLTTRGFLTGLRTIFISDGGNSFITGDGRVQRFKGRDLFIHSHLIFEKIDNNVIQEIIKKGIESEVPEISATCKMIAAFAGK